MSNKTSKPVALKDALTEDQIKQLRALVDEAQHKVQHLEEIPVRYFLIKKGAVLDSMLDNHNRTRKYLANAFKVSKALLGTTLCGISASGVGPTCLRFQFSGALPKEYAKGFVRQAGKSNYYTLRDPATTYGQAETALLHKAFAAPEEDTKAKPKKTKTLQELLGVSLGFPYMRGYVVTSRLLPRTGVIAISVPWIEVDKKALKAYKKLHKAGIMSSAEFELLVEFNEHKSLTEVRHSKYIEAFEKENEKAAKHAAKSKEKMEKAQKKAVKALRKEAKAAAKPAKKTTAAEPKVTKTAAKKTTTRKSAK